MFASQLPSFCTFASPTIAAPSCIVRPNIVTPFAASPEKPSMIRPVPRRDVRRENVVLYILFVEARMAGLIRVRVEAGRILLVTRVDLNQGAGVDRTAARRRDADHHVRRERLADREERVRGLTVL